MVIIDTKKRIFSINNEDFGSLCTGAEIKITPDNPPEVILHLVSDIKFKADNCVIQDKFQRLPRELTRGMGLGLCPKLERKEANLL